MGETEMTTTAPVSQRATPRLVDIEAQQETDESRVEKKERNFWTRVFQGIGIACICFNFAGVGVSYSGTVLVAALFALVASAAVIYYQMELQDTDTLRRVQNELRHSANEMATAVTGLSQENVRLGTKLVPLKETQEKLEGIANEQGSNVNKLVSLVKENGAIQKEQNACLQTDLMTDMFECLLNSERSEDGHLDDRESKMLCRRLKNLPHIQVNEELFLKKLEKQNSLNSVVGWMRQIGDETLPKEDRIFSLAESENDIKNRGSVELDG